MLKGSPILRAVGGLALLACLATVVSCGAASSGSSVGRPDLRIISVSGTPRLPVPSGVENPYSITVVVRSERGNVGTPFRVGLYISSDSTIDPVSDTFIEGKILSVMRAGEDVTLDFVGNFAPSFPGIFLVGAYADDDPAGGGSVPEGDEGNNSGLDPQILEIYPTTPPAPTIFLAEDTALFFGQWLTEGAIRLKWNAVPEALGYNLYVDPAPITPSNPGTKVNPTLIPGPSGGPGWNVQAFIDGTSQTNIGATPIPTNGWPNPPAGIYYYKVFSVDGIGVESTDGPEVIADHRAPGEIPEDLLSGSPGQVASIESIPTVTPTFSWTAASAPANWAFAIGEPAPGVDPVWVYFGFAPGQSSVMLPYGTVGDFTAKDASPLRNTTVYTWIVVGYDANGWGYLQGSPRSIQTPP